MGQIAGSGAAALDQPPVAFEHLVHRPGQFAQLTRQAGIQALALARLDGLEIAMQAA